MSQEETSIAIRKDRKRVWRGKCVSYPDVIEEVIRKRADEPELIVFETGPLSTWLYHALSEKSLPVVCIEARHAKHVLDEMSLNKTDAKDADGLARLAEAGFYKEVRVKSYDNMRARTAFAARGLLTGMSTKLSNHIRGVMKTFGLVVPKGKGGKFDVNVLDLLKGEDALAAIIIPMLDAWRTIRKQAATITRQVQKLARHNEHAQLLMTIPGVGAITSTSYLAAIEDPGNFRTSRSVGAWLGLTTRRYQSGEVEYNGRISRRGDKRLRALLYEAATALLTRSQEHSELKEGGIKLRERLGFKRAAVAVARKLAVIMHSMLQTGETFRIIKQEAAA